MRAAVRSRSKAEFLSALPGAAGRLTFCEGCDLTAPRSFDAAIAGCDAVIHTASPFALGVKGWVAGRMQRRVRLPSAFCACGACSLVGALQWHTC